MSDNQSINPAQLAQLTKFVLSKDDISRFKIAPVSQIYLKIEGQIYGPFQDEKLKELIPSLKDLFIHSMLRTAANDTWMFFFEHPLYDRRKEQLRFPVDFDWKNATFSYLAQGQKSAPLSLAKLKHYVASGQLRPLDHILIEPGDTWAKICQLPFFNRRGKKDGMALPDIPDEEVFADATRIAIARVNQEEHLDATLGEILSANEKANDTLGHLTGQILGRKKSTVIIRTLSAMALVVIVTALFTPSAKKSHTATVAQKTSAPMARVIGAAEGLGQKAKSIALKATSLKTKSSAPSKAAPVNKPSRGIASVATAPKTKTNKQQSKKTASVNSARTSSAAKAYPTPKQYKVAPIDAPTTVYGKPTRRPHLLSESERQSLDYEGTSINQDSAMMPVYDQDHPEENHRTIASEEEYGEYEMDDEGTDIDEMPEPSLREKMFIKKMRKAFQEQARKKKNEEEY